MDEDKQQKLIANASKVAQKNFRFFWRERFWDFRRKQPLCQFCAILCTISEEVNGEKVKEQFWLTDIIFDGKYVHGTVQVQPNQLTTIQQGMQCAVPLDRVEDWMYVIEDQVYGGYTINIIRQGLRQQDLATYDNSWGFQFGNPLYTEKYPKKPVVVKEEEEEKPPTKFFGITISKPKKKKSVQQDEVEENEYHTVNLEYDHPQAIKRFDKYKETFKKDPLKIHQPDENGWTPLLNHVLAGNRHIVQLLIDSGADLTARTHHGQSALELANSVGWAQIVMSLKKSGAT